MKLKIRDNGVLRDIVAIDFEKAMVTFKNGDLYEDLYYSVNKEEREDISLRLIIDLTE